jgi:hypothetical protein
MFNQSNYSDTYEREKLRILQTLNVQIQSMAVKLDQIVSQVEENVFKIKSSPKTSLITINTIDPNNSIKPATLNSITLTPAIINTNTNKIIELSSNHQLVKIIDQPIPESEITPVVAKPVKTANRKSRSIKNLTKHVPTPSATTSNGTISTTTTISNEPPKVGLKSDTTAKRNKQQRQFNTFVRESINQLLGADFMKTHDVQDIDQQVMEMIRKEAVENYLPDNIRPRRAWHLAKASLRTLKRTLNNRKT